MLSARNTSHQVRSERVIRTKHSHQVRNEGVFQHETQVIRSEVKVLSEQNTSHQVRSEGVFQHETQVIRSEEKVFSARNKVIRSEVTVWRIVMLASNFLFKLSLLGGGGGGSFFVVYSFHSGTRCCWSFVDLCSLALLLSFLCFPASSGLLYFTLVYTCLLSRPGSDSLVSISGLRPLPGW